MEQILVLAYSFESAPRGILDLMQRYKAESVKAGHIKMHWHIYSILCISCARFAAKFAIASQFTVRY